MIKKTLAAAVAAFALCTPAFAANIVLNNVDPADVGFNDPTPATPVGGNAGKTVGAQRLIAYQKALELWGKTLRSNVTIVVRGSFARLDCERGVLAQAGALQIFADFPNAPLPGHWYHVALANAIAGEDLTPGPLDVPGPDDPFNDDIRASFNGDIGKADCLPGPGWYYGLDNNAPPGEIDFLDTFMHEVAHGLGFSNFANEADGTTPEGLPDVYMANTFDLLYGAPWNTTVYGPQTSLFLRLSAVNTNNVVWTGSNVKASQSLILGPYEGIRLTGTLNRELEFGTAGFGPPVTAANFGGAIVPGTGADGNTLGCLPITAPVAGKIAYVDRGGCTFVVKVKNAQLAGATGAIVGNNAVGGGAFGLGGADPTITIPSIGVSTANGAAIKASSPGVSVEFFSDPSRQAGTTDGYLRLYAPSVVALGSSISHFDTSASPSLLMEPFINSDLRSARNLDLSAALMQDIGWQLETVKVGACDSGVPSVLRNGQMLHANVSACATGAGNRGQFVSCMTAVADTAKKAGLITGAQQGMLVSCAGIGQP